MPGWRFADATAHEIVCTMDVEPNCMFASLGYVMVYTCVLQLLTPVLITSALEGSSGVIQCHGNQLRSSKGFLFSLFFCKGHESW